MDILFEHGFKGPWLRQFNIIIKNKFFKDDDIQMIFGNKEVFIIDDTKDMFDILVMFGFFPSKGEAKRNWKKTTKEVPDGFSEFWNIGNKWNSLFIWKPTTNIVYELNKRCPLCSDMNIDIVENKNGSGYYCFTFGKFYNPNMWLV